MPSQFGFTDFQIGTIDRVAYSQEEEREAIFFVRGRNYFADSIVDNLNVNASGLPSGESILKSYELCNV